jgi:uroporphyrinogen-III synthase
MKSAAKTRVPTGPLSGVRVLVGRARHQAGALSGELRKLGASVVEIPFIEIRKPRSFQQLDSALKDLKAYDWLILTSVNGVEAMWDRLGRLRISNRQLKHLHLAAIGPATKKAIVQQGLKVDVVPKEYVAESVVRSLKKKVKGKRVLLVRAKVARDVIPRELRRAGAHLDVVEAYETVVPQSSRKRLRSALNNSADRTLVVTFTSSSTVRNFVALLGGPRQAASKLQALARQQGRHQPRPAGRILASIGPVTSSTLRELGLRVDVQAAKFTIPGLVQAVTRILAKKAGNRQ